MGHDLSLVTEKNDNGGGNSGDIQLNIDDESINGHDSNGEEITGLNTLTSGGTATGSGKISENWDVDRYFFTVPKSGEVTIDLAAEKGSINIKAGSSRGSQSHFRSERQTHHMQTFNANAGDVVHLTIWDQDTSAAYGYTLKICFSASCDSGGGDSGKIWRPDLDFSQEDVYASGTVIRVNTAFKLTNAIESAVPDTTILLEDGIYEDVHIKFPKGKRHITIKAEHKHKATIIGSSLFQVGKLNFSFAPRRYAIAIKFLSLR